MVDSFSKDGFLLPPLVEDQLGKRPIFSCEVHSAKKATSAVASGPVTSGAIKHSREHSVDRQPSKKGPGYVWDFIPEPVSGPFLLVFDIYQQKWVRSEIVD